jgi:uncharacterized membrane protein HdeD (DUF308 family)
MTEQDYTPTSGMLEGIRENASLTITLGVILILAGLFALFSPLLVGLSVTVMVGTLAFVSGVAQCLLAFKIGAFGRGLLTFVVGVLMTVTGLYLISRPVAGLASITLLLAAYFWVTGVIEVITAFQSRPAQGWGWQLFSGIVTLLLGIILWRQFPVSGVWAVGTLFGIKMLFSGWTLVFLGRHLKTVTNG